MEPEADVVVVAPAASPQQTETVAETTVEVAQIQAERDVQIAQEATKQVEILAEAQADETDEDVLWLRAELADLRGQCATNGDELSQLRGVIAAMQEQQAQMAEQMQAMMLLANPPQPEPQSTPEPVSEPANNPPDGDGDGRGDQGQQEPPANPAPPAKRRERKWLR